MQTSAFETAALELLALMERLPFPAALAWDPSCSRVRGNQAFRMLTEGYTAPDLHAALESCARERKPVGPLPVRLLAPDGTAKTLLASAWPLEAAGEIAGSVALYTDAPESGAGESERRYRAITEAMPQFVWLDAPDGSAIYANRRWLDYTGLSEAENAGFGWERTVHPDDRARLEGRRAETLRTGEAYEDECRYRGKDGKYRWFLFRCIPIRDDAHAITGWLGTATDIDKQKRAEAQQAFFALASDLLASTLDVEHTLERIARLAIVSLGTWCQIDLPDASGALRVAMVAHQDPAKEELLRGLIGRSPYDGSANFGPPEVHRSGRPQLLHGINESVVAQVIPDEADRRLYGGAGYTSGVIVPLRHRGKITGVLGIASDDPSRLYTEFDRTTALELGRRGASALENARSYEREHRMASTLQEALLPATLPQAAAVEFFAAYAAAAWAEGEVVGGDWYDAFPLDENRIAVSIGDVAGHGVQAAVTMGSIRQALRAAALGGASPPDVLTHANRVIALEGRAPMITAVFGVYDAGARSFTYSIAGHPPPLLVRAGGSVAKLTGAAPPLGLAFEERSMRALQVRVERGDALVFYTDGLIEYARDVVRGTARLERAAGERTFLSSAQPAQQIIDAVLDAPQRDDIAVLVMKALS